MLLTLVKLSAWPTERHTEKEATEGPEGLGKGRTKGWSREKESHTHG